MQRESVGSNTCPYPTPAQEFQQWYQESTGQWNLDPPQELHQYQQSNDEVQHSNSQEPCLSPPTITLMKTNISTSEEDYGCGEIEHHENDNLGKFAKSNQMQNQQQQEPE